MFLKVDHHQSGCMLCKSVSGPFVVWDGESFNMETVNGPLAVSTPLVLCAPTEQREGCAGEVARVTGYLPPEETVALRAQYADTLERCTQLEGELATARDDKMVSVPELLKFLGETDDAASV